jgi:hypothetical protein
MTLKASKSLRKNLKWRCLCCNKTKLEARRDWKRAKVQVPCYVCDSGGMWKGIKERNITILDEMIYKELMKEQNEKRPSDDKCVSEG